MRCPRDAVQLQRALVGAGTLAFTCPKCHGRAITLPVLRRQLTDDAANELWRLTRAAGSERIDSASCPACRLPMVTIGLTDELGGEEIDVCRRCQLVWWDPREDEHLPRRPLPRPFDDGLTPEERQRFAIDQVMELARIEREQSPPSIEDPRALPALLGLPIELDNGRSSTFPWLTWLTAFAITLVSVAGILHPDVVTDLALVPADALPFGYQLLTVALVHGSWLHLLGNLWFLVVFGDDVELRLGRARWAILLVVATLAGSLLHVALDPASNRPCVGASGGISGLIVCYALLLPNARLGMYFDYRWRVEWITFSAGTGIIAWVLLQGALLIPQLLGLGSVSALAHLGGAAVGVLAWAAWRVPVESRPR